MTPRHQNSKATRRSNIWFLAHPSVVTSIIHSSEQVIIAECIWQTSHFRVAVIHGANDQVTRLQLWAELLSFTNGNTVFIGDFNAIKGAHERLSTAVPSRSACKEFCDFIDATNFIESPTSGLYFTWSGRRLLPRHVESRLDRALFSTSFAENWSDIVTHALPRVTSDHSPLIFKCSSNNAITRRPFKFLNMWVSHPSFLDMVNDSWSASVDSRCPIYRVMSKLRRLRGDIRIWNRTTFGNVDTQIQEGQRTLMDVQQKISVLGYTDALFDEEIAAQAGLNITLTRKNMLLQKKSRANWLLDGDRNSAFFHRIIRSRKQNQRIAHLRINGVMTYDSDVIQQHIIDFFSNLFNQEGQADVDRTLLEAIIDDCVTTEQNNHLICTPNDDEITAAVFGMDSNSAPGPDGFSGRFFHSCWHIVKDDVISAVKAFYLNSYLPSGCNASTLILIPKKESVDTVADLRPIILSNFFFKIISKILATRLGLVATVTVSGNQFGFIGDDILIFCKASIRNARKIKEILDLYGEISGQNCNTSKSNIFFSNGVVNNMRMGIRRELGFSMGTLPVLYLGVPLFTGRIRASYLAAIHDKIVNKFSRWKGSVDTKPSCSVRWTRVCAPRVEGGLGVRSFSAMNNSYLMKMAWRIIHGQEYGPSILKTRYLTKFGYAKHHSASSPFWTSIRQHVDDLVENSFAYIGTGRNTYFWKDDWLGYRLLDKLRIPPFMNDYLNQAVDDYYYDGIWHFTAEFVINFPDVVVDILLLPIGEEEDCRLWKSSVNGTVTAAAAYATQGHHFPKVSWGSWIWEKFIPERRSLLCWRIIHRRLPTFDCLMTRGLMGPNRCAICGVAEESINHLFWECGSIQPIWKELMAWFNKDYSHFIDIHCVLVAAWNEKFSSQVLSFWKAGIINLLWRIWDCRNNIIFNETIFHRQLVTGFLKVMFKEMDLNFSKLGNTTNSWSDYLAMRSIGVATRAAPPPIMIEVHWWPPVGQWIKVNTDGSALGAPGNIAVGGVFRDKWGWVRGCFHYKGGVGFAFEAELLAVMYAVAIAHNRGWTLLWIESDSFYIVKLLHSRSEDIPWRFLASWKRTLRLLLDFRLQISHIYREGNSAADIMASHARSEGWWPHAIDEIKYAVATDMATHSRVRIKY
ncbi:uncharacterized protein LOC130990877 [Salvia miltiorrhiza]|uniref:uncharacterized protein LOC130990877 n=1 Tax=Salvia miltiorrhiza TaxID=226208 RepID=UPI0025ACE8A5|nr:uncharacterized protein LOC130990877 [Salvia miltiorrhiza]